MVRCLELQIIDFFSRHPLQSIRVGNDGYSAALEGVMKHQQVVSVYDQLQLSSPAYGYILMNNQSSKVVKEEVIYQGKFLGMKYVDYTIGTKIVHNYQKIFRTTTKPGRIESVDIVPIILYQHRSPELIMNVEFRAPVHGYTLEFPTGMTEDDNYEDNAKREMLEETGYVIDKIVKMPSPTLYYDPWKSDENALLFLATINGDDPSSFKGQRLQHDEDIKIVKFSIDDKLLEKIVEYSKEHNLRLESKVYTLCVGIWLKYNLGTL